MENNDLISVDGFVRWLDVGKYRNANEKCFSERNVAAMIKDFALTDSVDAVPVIRCRDCKYSFNRQERKPLGCYYHGKNGITLHDADDFCSYGERIDGRDK